MEINELTPAQIAIYMQGLDGGGGGGGVGDKAYFSTMSEYRQWKAAKMKERE